MFTNNFKLAWRNLLKDRQFTFLNLVGLSTGLACVLLIYLWLNDELSVDKFNAKDKRLFEVKKNSPNSEGVIYTHENTQGLLARSMANELPEIEYAVCVRKGRETGVLSFENKQIKALPRFADKDFFNVFSYKLLKGNRSKPLAEKYGVLLSDKLASKLFNNTQDIIGKTVSWLPGDEFNGSYTISGVFEAPPANASDQFDLLFSFDLYEEKKAGGMGDISYWGSNMVSTYLVVKEGTNIDQFNKKIKDFSKAKIGALYKDKDMMQWEGDLFVHPYSDGYLYDHYENGKQSGGRIEYVKLFSIIAIFILMIACINFMNLATAKAARRLKEIGIKKVVGASRRSLVFQYLGESMLMAFVSLLISLVLVSLLLPAFREITGKQFNLHLNSGLILSLLAITIITGIIAGSYPAFYLSGFKPILILKGKQKNAVSESLVRKGLVVFQFAISVMLIVSVLVVYQQMNLIQTSNLGYSKDNIIHFANEGKLTNNLATFLNEVKKIPGVVQTSDADGDFLGRAGHSGGGIDWQGKDPKLGIEYYGVGVDYDFIEMMGLKVITGRAFSRAFGSDSSKVIFNEAAINAMGMKDPIGKTVSLWGTKKQIIGIVKDYHFESMYKKVGPAFLECFQNNNNILVKIKGGSEKETVASIDQLYKQFNEGLPFDYKFLDDDYQALYAAEQRVAVLSRYFAGVAILISCLGLFGLAAFTAQRRQKEICIRKVVGASVSNVAIMLSADFCKLVLLALLIAIPASWWAADQWLQSFAYRIHIKADLFILASLVIMGITLFTVSFQTIKAAIVNPVKSLRTE